MANLLWIVWYDYMNICEWLIGVEYDVYHSVVYFLLTLILRNNMLLLNYMIKSMLVNTYMLSDGDVVGDFIYAKWMMMMWWWLLIELWLDWLCERKFDNAIVVEVDQYKWRLSFILLLSIYEVILHCRVFACMSMHHSHVELLML